MPVLRIVTDIRAPVETCFDLARSIDLHLESMIVSEERAVAGVKSGLIGYGEEVSWEARHLGRLWRMTSRITEFEAPHRFVDEMIRGPFRSFRHEHGFEPHGDVTRMTDVVRFWMGLGILGRIADPFAMVYLRRLRSRGPPPSGARPRTAQVDGVPGADGGAGAGDHTGCGKPRRTSTPGA